MTDAVAKPLTLVMTIKSADDYQKLIALLEQLQSLPADKNPISIALTKIATVHFARFVFLDSERLAVITTYDGDFDDYIAGFVREIGHVFDQLSVHMQDAPPLPVEKNSDAFLDYVKSHDLKCMPPFYSAYPNLKVLDILTLERDAQSN